MQKPECSLIVIFGWWRAMLLWMDNFQQPCVFPHTCGVAGNLLYWSPSWSEVGVAWSLFPSVSIDIFLYIQKRIPGKTAIFLFFSIVIEVFIGSISFCDRLREKEKGTWIHTKHSFCADFISVSLIKHNILLQCTSSFSAHSILMFGLGQRQKLTKRQSLGLIQNTLSGLSCPAHWFGMVGPLLCSLCSFLCGPSQRSDSSRLLFYVPFFV